MAAVQFGMQLNGDVDPLFVPTDEQVESVQHEQKLVREDFRRKRYSSNLPTARQIRLATEFQREIPLHPPLWQNQSPENVQKIEKNFRKSTEVKHFFSSFLLTCFLGHQKSRAQGERPKGATTRTKTCRGGRGGEWSYNWWCFD